MTIDAKLKLVSKNCLHDRPSPRSLQVLWQAQEDGDPFLADVLGLKLLTSLDVLEDGYGEGIANGNPDILANVHAHRRVFERLGFFAEGDNGELLGFDFQSSDAEEPPVVELDTEGTYDWKGVNLAEVIYRIAEDGDQTDEARDWLAAHDLAIVELGELGSTTQFLPSIKDYHERLYYQNLGQPREVPPMAKNAADPRDPFTWLLRPATEVRAAIGQLFHLPAGAGPKEFCVWCNADALVTNVKWLRRPETADVAVHGVKFGMPEAEVRAKLGEPTEAGAKVSWIAYRLPQGRLRILVKNHEVVEISVGVNK